MVSAQEKRKLLSGGYKLVGFYTPAIFNQSKRAFPSVLRNQSQDTPAIASLI